MFAIDDPTAVAVMPTPEAAGTPGFWTEGNPGLGQAATLMRASFFNAFQQELLNILVAANITPSKTTYNQLLQAILKVSGRSSRVRGLTGTNNGATPNTQFDFSAGAVEFRDPTSGICPSVTNVGSITNNILTAGPAANGRDQAGAFSASSWVHFYFIYNITTGTVATISSASAPPTGPALPTGYTAWAYIGAVYLSAGSVLAGGYFRGSWFTYKASNLVVNAGTQVLRTAVSLVAAVPPNALMIRPRVTLYQVQSNGAGTYLGTVTIEAATVLSVYEYGIGGTGGANLNFFGLGGATLLPNIGQNINYFHTVTTGSNQSANIAIDGYSNPNGGE